MRVSTIVLLAVAFVALAFVAVEAKDALTETDYQNFVRRHSAHSSS